MTDVKGCYGGDTLSMPPLEVPETNLLNSLRLIFETINNQEERKLGRIKANHQMQLNDKIEAIRDRDKQLEYITEVIKLIPDIQIYPGQNFSLSDLKNWVKEKLEDEKLAKESFAEKQLSAKVRDLTLKLLNVETNQIPTSQIFLQDKKKRLTVLKKKVDLGQISSGTLLNSTINIPNGYELDRIILKEVK